MQTFDFYLIISTWPSALVKVAKVLEAIPSPIIKTGVNLQEPT